MIFSSSPPFVAPATAADAAVRSLSFYPSVNTQYEGEYMDLDGIRDKVR